MSDGQPAADVEFDVVEGVSPTWTESPLHAGKVEAGMAGNVDEHDHTIVEVRRGRLWLRPVLAVEWGSKDRHRKVDWSELFVDLVVVALALRISSSVKYDLAWKTMASVSVQYVVFYLSWFDLASFVSRFNTNDLGFKLLMMFQITGMIVMVLNVDKAPALRLVRKGFSNGSICATVSVGVALTINGILLPRVRTWAFRHVVGVLLNLPLMVGAIFAPETWQTVLLWFLGCILRLVVIMWTTVGDRTITVPLDIGHIAERYGLIVMIVLGESILGQVLADRTDSLQYYFQVILGTLIAYTLHVLYFESQPFTAALHALRRSRLAGFTFVYGHMLLFLACILFGAALKIVLFHVVDDLVAREVWLLGGSYTATLTLIMVVRMSHRGWRSELGMLRVKDRLVRLRARRRTGVESAEVMDWSPSSQQGAAASSPDRAAEAKSAFRSPAVIRAGTYAVAVEAAHSAHRCGCIDRCLQQFMKHPSQEARRRRFIWMLRFLLIVLSLVWMAISLARPSEFSVLGYTAGFALIGLFMHGLDYPDVVNYSDVVHHK